MLASLGPAADQGPGLLAAASSVSAPPLVGVLEEFVWPTPTPTPTPSPTPTPTPTPTPAPTPTPTPVPPPPPPPPPPPAPKPAPQPVVQPAPQPTPPPAAAGYLDTAMGAQVLAQTNELRAHSGLAPLKANGALTTAAQNYAQTMAARNWFDHRGPDGSTFDQRNEAAGYSGWTYLSEVLYRGPLSDTAGAIVGAWAASPSHLSALVSPSPSEIGVGCYVLEERRYCAEEIGAR